jgi:membrane protease YdiL (CAAX protease family)
LLSGAMFYSRGITASPDLTLKAIILFSIVNPVFEETLVAAYIVKSLEKKYRPIFIITISTLLRFSYHTYQGVFALISIIPLGLIFAYYYWRWKKLWPLIFAHMLADLLGLALLMG